MTLTQFVRAVRLMRHAQSKKADNPSVKWIVQAKRYERIVDTCIEQFFKKQTEDIPKEGDLFPPE